MVGVGSMWLHDDEQEQGHYSGQVTPDGVIVAAALAVVLVSVSGVGVATTLRASITRSTSARLYVHGVLGVWVQGGDDANGVKQ